MVQRQPEPLDTANGRHEATPPECVGQSRPELLTACAAGRTGADVGCRGKPLGPAVPPGPGAQLRLSKATSSRTWPWRPVMSSTLGATQAWQDVEGNTTRFVEIYGTASSPRPPWLAARSSTVRYAAADPYARLQGPRREPHSGTAGFRPASSW